MAVLSISAEEAVQSVLARERVFDAVIDARSPGEFAEDHLSGALNWPSLDDDERRVVGTDYKQTGGFEAKKLGAALVARNVAAHIEREVKTKPADWRPLVYCWRGGKRSGTLAWFLDQIGFQTTVVAGGYKAFRAAMLLDLTPLCAPLQFRVICGKTGSGKTRLLQALKGAGEQVLDLEALAEHRGSVLGLLPGVVQPTQKTFDTRIWATLKAFDATRVVWVEAESKKVGNVQVPLPLMTRIRETGQCWVIALSDASRVELLLEEYDFFVQDPAFFCQRIEALIPLRGHETVNRWQAQARAGQWRVLFLELMHSHYDPVYEQSMARNFAGYAAAPRIEPKTHSFESFCQIVQDWR